MEVGGSRLTSTGIQISMEVGGTRLPQCKLVEASIETHASSTVGRGGSFHCFHQLPRIYPVEASMSFHIPLQTSAYFHEYQKLPATSTRFPQESANFRPICFRGRLHQLPWRLTWKSIFFHGSFHRSRWKNTYFPGNFHVSGWT